MISCKGEFEKDDLSIYKTVNLSNFKTPASVFNLIKKFPEILLSGKKFGENFSLF